MLTHAQIVYVCSSLLRYFIRLCTDCDEWGWCKGKTYNSDDVVRQSAGDVVVEDGDASVRLDATDL